MCVRVCVCVCVCVCACAAVLVCGLVVAAAAAAATHYAIIWSRTVGEAADAVGDGPRRAITLVVVIVVGSCSSGPGRSSRPTGEEARSASMMTAWLVA